ncbi:ADR211Wp [Eremothecium gossypii ATCC 10895]|uniref:ADR211Wp n=1 Tax=Eremothecium gossypii (strain ATCC 10895 / CBS 109.51 / FGSC 9923 / NRRL Y-1056) TaxID=284811 RepID=Q759R2_EREGS|nr:ADR211Wp [Eremothecium gossypii ATCC 10895]AAS52131.1 ADR211Wp [Eremothecium gossypii ATCC 10895]
MDSNNWLEAPKWGSATDNTVGQLSQTLGTLGQGVLGGSAAKEELEHNAWGAGPERTGNENDGAEGQEEHSQKLLSTLAPHEDPLQGLGEIRSPGKDDPLFAGGSPLTVEPEPQGTNRAAGGKKHGKVQRLFSTTMRRRAALGAEQRADLIQDPLAREAAPTQPAPAVEVARPRVAVQAEAPLFELPAQERVETAPAAPVALETFAIAVVDPVKVADRTFSHVEYSVRTRSPLVGDAEVSVQRRYRDFRWLYRQLQSNHWGKVIPPPPDKQKVGRFKQDFIENRRFQMERMLQRIAQNAALQNDQDFLLFLTSTNFVQDSKEREQATGSRASSDSNDLSEIHLSELTLLGPDDAESVIRNGGLESDTGSLFMSLSFSSVPKYTEPDTFIMEKRQHIDVMEEQLRQMYKSLELVDSQKNELVSVIKEFAATINSLVELEASKRISSILSNFAEVHLRIMESLQRTSLQDSLTLGVTIDEYLRSLGSIKAVFNQRAKLGYYLVIVESDLHKKQAHLQKLTTSGKSPTDKAAAAKQELANLQRRHKTIKDHWEHIAETLRDELAAYSEAKITDFRNNLEIYLESAIETQKECIELWETFYQNNL